MKNSIHIGLVLNGGRGWMGGYEYIKGLALALASLPKDLRAGFTTTIVTNGALSDSEICQLAVSDTKVISSEKEGPRRTLGRRGLWKLRKKFLKQSDPAFRDLVRQKRIDFVYPYLPESGVPPNFNYASWIYDFQHRYLPQLFSSEEVLARNKRFERAARTSPLVVLSSKTAENDFQQFYPFASSKARLLRFRTPQPESSFSGDPVLAQREYCLPDKFFLAPNQFWKHKNHLLLFKALKLLAEQAIFPAVVLSGSVHDYRFPEYTDEILQTIHRLGIQQQVYLMGILPRTDYVQLMRRSIAVIQPSLFEGWSTVVEDARSLGKVIILSDLPVHKEQDPPKGIFFDRTSAESLACKLREQWTHLSPGPDLGSEKAAHAFNYGALMQVGEQLLGIACESCSA